MERMLTRSEYQFAYQNVFALTLPLWDRIFIDDSLGLGDRPWTNWIEGNAYLHLGPIAKEDLTLNSPDKYWSGFGRYCDVFIHEMTHVWQYYHGRYVKTTAALHQLVGWALEYTVTSFESFTDPNLDDIYAYDIGHSWDSYNVEQQAQIVEDWFSSDTANKKNPGKASRSDPRWTYIQKVRLAGEHWGQDARDDRAREADSQRRTKIEHYGHNF